MRKGQIAIWRDAPRVTRKHPWFGNQESLGSGYTGCLAQYALGVWRAGCSDSLKLSVRNNEYHSSLIRHSVLPARYLIKECGRA